MANIEKCALCGEKKPLLKSHMIPKFVVDWIKRSSATGYVRQVVNPNLRKQDIDKVRLLCGDCEQLFSKFEKQFAEKIFIPFLEKEQKTFSYDEWLLKFVVSMAWRAVISEMELFRKDRPHLVPHVEKAFEIWKDYLLGRRQDPGPYEHYVLFWDAILKAEGAEVPRGLNMYLLRGADLTIPSSNEVVCVYSKLPGITFWTGVEPPHPDDWISDRAISKSGKIELGQQYATIQFQEFLHSRNNLIQGHISNMSFKQEERIAQTMLDNPERAIDSKTFEAHQAEELWRMKSAKELRNWQSVLLIQRDPELGCIPTGYEWMLRVSRIKGIDYEHFQEEFNLQYKTEGEVKNNFATIAEAVQQKYPFVKVNIKNFEKGEEKVKFIEDLLQRNIPCLISMTLNVKGGWHIAPVVRIDNQWIFVIWAVNEEGKPELHKYLRSDIIKVHDELPGGKDIAWVEQSTP